MVKNMKKTTRKIKESYAYGPFKNYNTYKRALAKWNNSTKDRNDECWDEFETNITDAVNYVLTDYYMKGCRYSAKDISKALQYYINDPAPFSFADLIENEDDFEEHDYYEENEGMKESYGPYGSKDEYENNLRDYKGRAEKANMEHLNDFSNDLLNIFKKDLFDSDFYDEVAELYFYYESKFGCRYDRDEIEEYIQEARAMIKMGEDNIESLESFFSNPDPWSMQDMMNNDNYDFDEKVNITPLEKRLKEKEKCNKSVRNIIEAKRKEMI